MGLFDGRDGATEAGSTAQLAKWLGAPVLLVLDASVRAGSHAAAWRHCYALLWAYTACQACRCTMLVWPAHKKCSCVLAATGCAPAYCAEHLSAAGSCSSCLPLLLVQALARSAAAVAKGYIEFDPELRLGGLLFNKVGLGGATAHWCSCLGCSAGDGGLQCVRLQAAAAVAAAARAA